MCIKPSPIAEYENVKSIINSAYELWYQDNIENITVYILLILLLLYIYIDIFRSRCSI